MPRETNPREHPAPALQALHQALARHGTLHRDALEGLSETLRMPLADLYRVATFYHYFEGGERRSARSACEGPACSLHGSILGRNGQAGQAIACPGLCDQPVAIHEEGRFAPLAGGPGVLRLPEAVSTEEALFAKIRTPGMDRLENYRASGGYQRLLDLLAEDGAHAALEKLEASGLTGRGGAGFPLAAKWRAVREAPGLPKYVVCNADEGEPGTFKDRPLLHLHPHLLLEAMAIAGAVVGASVGIIYLRYEYPEAFGILGRAIREAEAAGLLGSKIGGGGFDFEVHMARGAGSYVCGEETALLNSLEGRVPWPRERPPFPSTHGLWGKPSLVNNVETLCQVPRILEKGPAWFRSLGRNGNAGTKIYSISGRVRRPGNYELPLGTTARQLIFEHAGGPAEGRRLKAFTLGGISGGLLDAGLLDLELDYRSPQRHGAHLGSGGVIVLDDRCCVVDFARACMLFYESESCGRCFPCRVGTVRLRERLDGLTGRAPLPAKAQEQMEEIGATMAATSACGLGQGAPLVTQGLFRRFGDEIEEHLGRRCKAGLCFESTRGEHGR